MTTEAICECGGILDYEPEHEEFDSYWACVNPDCAVVTLPSTIVQEIQDYNDACKKLTAYWKIHHKEYEAYN